MAERDLNKIAALERAVTQRWGKDVVKNPRADWNDEKEREFKEQQKRLYEREKENKREEEKIEIDGVFVSRKLINKETNRICPICDTYSFDSQDDLYMNKYGCCAECFYTYVDGREERWLSGWRPNDEERRPNDEERTGK